ncbi:MAG: DUF4314 domain-containing protein [Oscillospiraceae bacterium]
MKFPSKATIEQYRREYPVGCRVKLVSMAISGMPIGTRGTVRGSMTRKSACSVG